MSLLDRQSKIRSFLGLQINLIVIDQTPPRRDLKVSDPAVRDKTLFQLQLAPSSVLMLSFFDESLNRMFARYPIITWTFNSILPFQKIAYGSVDAHVPAPLEPSILAEAKDLPAAPRPPPPPADPSNQTTDFTKLMAAGSSALSQAEKKIPKWLKIGST